MEIITNRIDTKPLIVEHIVGELNKILVKEGEKTGKINLSLDLTRPEYIMASYSELTDGTHKLDFEYFRSDKLLIASSLEYKDASTLPDFVSKFIDAADEKLKEETSPSKDWYKVRMIDQHLSAMENDEYYQTQLTGANGKPINLDKEALLLLRKYYGGTDASDVKEG